MLTDDRAPRATEPVTDLTEHVKAVLGDLLFQLVTQRAEIAKLRDAVRRYESDGNRQPARTE